MRSGVLWLAVLLVIVASAPAEAKTPAPVGPDPAVEAWPYWPYPSSCGIAPAFDPVEVFSGPTGAEDGSAPSALALREVLVKPELAWLGLPKHDWRLASEDGRYSEFVWGRLGGNMQRVTLENEAGTWKLLANGTCELQSLVGERWAVNWTLARTQPRLGKNTRKISVNLSGGPCSGGMSQNDRAHPVFRQIGPRLLLAIVLDPLPPGVYTCQGVVEPPLLVRLPGRLGKRTLFDSGGFPPRLAAETRSPTL
jgi:hypothetical protein